MLRNIAKIAQIDLRYSLSSGLVPNGELESSIYTEWWRLKCTYAHTEFEREDAN